MSIFVIAIVFAFLFHMGLADCFCLTVFLRQGTKEGFQIVGLHWCIIVQ